MDMSMPYDPAVANLPITDPKCIQAAEACTAFYAAENASQAATPWASQFRYGHWTSYYYVIIIGILFLLQIYHYGKDKGFLRMPASSIQQQPTPSLLRKLQAAGRAVFYRRLPSTSINWLDAPSDVGTLAFLLVTIIFLIGLTFAARPYYREHLGYGSPPIAIRTGLMSFACIPILVALSGKVNIVTILTGISHERLNVLHRWIAWMSFALALIHTLPFFVGSLNDWGNGGYARVKKEFYGYGMDGDDLYSGAPPLGILFGICILSLPQIRHRFYETFYAVHILLAITYLGLLFWHAGNQIDSWYYLWATVAVWSASWLARVFWKTQPLNPFNKLFNAAPATLTSLPGEVTRVDIWPQDNFKWRIGQHAFLRFSEIAPLENHPFTIASVPPTSGSERCHLVFLVRSHTGITQKLASYVQSHSEKDTDSVTTRVWIDGPYGGIRRPLHNRYHSLILIAGGTGVAACFPLLLHTITTAQTESTRLRRVIFIWAMKKAEAIAWLSDEFKNLEALDKGSVEVIIRFHVTADIDPPKEEAKERGLSSAYEERLSALGVVAEGRPAVSAVLGEYIRAGERTMVIGCGPSGMRTDIGNAVAGLQKRVLVGECVEIGMHLETFGW